MSEFVDRVLIQFSNPAQLIELLSPTADATHARILMLLNASYDMPLATVHDVRKITVRSLELARGFFPLERRSGTWTQTTPGLVRTEVAYEITHYGRPAMWIDISATLNLTLLLEFDAAKVQSITPKMIEGFTTLDQFRNQFRFIDLDAFMAKHNLSTVEELRDAFDHLMLEIKMRAPPAFDPNDPANEYLLTLGVALLIRDGVDVAAALRDAKLARKVMEQTLAFQREAEAGEMRTPYALVVVFPAAEVSNADAVRDMFALEQVSALFVTPL